jgi:uncharacterized protein
MNERLGMIGAWSDVIGAIAARRPSLGPFGWMLVGVVGGAAGYALVAGGPVFHGYSYLTDAFSGTGGAIVVAAILLAAGFLEDRRRLHLGQRPERQRDGLPREPRRDDDLLRDRDRRHGRHGGAALVRTRVAGALIGVVFGVVLTWSGLTSPDVIRDGLLFRDAYLFLLFGTAVTTAFAGLWLLRRRAPRALLTGERVAWEPIRPERRHVAGSLLFGVGWGVAGACPGPIATQLGQGIAWGVPTAVGLVAGILLFGRLQARAAARGDRSQRVSVIPSPQAGDATA